MKEATASEHDKFIEEKYILDLLEPIGTGDTMKISMGNSSQLSYIKGNPGEKPNDFSMYCSLPCDRPFRIMEGYSIPKAELRQGMLIRFSCANGKYKVSTVVRDLFSKEILLEIIDNKVQIDKLGRDFHSTNKSLEVIDRYGNTAFSLWIEENVINIRGYFVGNDCTIFLNDENPGVAFRENHSDIDYKSKAEKQAQKIRSRFINQ